MKRFNINTVAIFMYTSKDKIVINALIIMLMHKIKHFPNTVPVSIRNLFLPVCLPLDRPSKVAPGG
jgi:hypothetical protein